MIRLGAIDGRPDVHNSQRLVLVEGPSELVDRDFSYRHGHSLPLVAIHVG